MRFRLRIGFRQTLISDIFMAYENRCFSAGAMDFDDLLYKMNVLLSDNPDILMKYQHRFQYIMVDEYQDTNFAQYLIIKQLVQRIKMCVLWVMMHSLFMDSEVRVFRTF